MTFKPTVLFCDDEESMHVVARYCLQEHCNLINATSAAEALIALASNDIDVMVTDQRMPEMDGSELCLRAAQISPRTKQILLTAYCDYQDLKRAANSGCLVGCLQKPMRSGELLDAIQRAITSNITAPTYAPPPAAPKSTPPSPRRSRNLFARDLAYDNHLREREVAAEVMVASALEEMRTKRNANSIELPQLFTALSLELEPEAPTQRMRHLKRF